MTFRAAFTATSLLAAALALAASSPPTHAADPKPAPPAPAIDEKQMAEMMAKAKHFTAPGAQHALLERFLGTWDTEMRVVMMPGAKSEKGSATFSWLMEGRWLQARGTGTMMGLPNEWFAIFGYDNFKQSYVSSAVSSMDTAMLRWEGDVDPKTGALVGYGTLDEYLTGEHDKMVKYVWRFPDADTMIYELHDLPIGETNAKVVEFVFKRRGTSAPGVK